MLVCNECGKEVVTGWILGFPSAPDSQKIALCPEHNTVQNRKKALRGWRVLMQTSIKHRQPRRAALASPHGAQILTIYYVGGGVTEHPCISHGVTPQQTLRIDQPGGETLFIPLQSIRQYSLAPAKKTASASPASSFSTRPAR